MVTATSHARNWEPQNILGESHVHMSKVKQVEEGTSEDLSFLGAGEIGTWYFITILLSNKARRGCLQGWCFVFGIFDRAANQKQCKWYVCNMLYFTQSQRAASIFIVKLNLVCNGEPWKQSLLQVPGSHIWETKSHANQGLSKKEQGVVMWQWLKIHKAQS